MVLKFIVRGAQVSGNLCHFQARVGIPRSLAPQCDVQEKRVGEVRGGLQATDFMVK